MYVYCACRHSSGFNRLYLTLWSQGKCFSLFIYILFDLLINAICDDTWKHPESCYAPFGCKCQQPWQWWLQNQTLCDSPSLNTIHSCSTVVEQKLQQTTVYKPVMVQQEMQPLLQVCNSMFLQRWRGEVKKKKKKHHHHHSAEVMCPYSLALRLAFVLTIRRFIQAHCLKALESKWITIFGLLFSFRDAAFQALAATNIPVSSQYPQKQLHYLINTVISPS